MATHEFLNRPPVPLPRLSLARRQLHSEEPATPSELDAQPTWIPRPTNPGRFSEKKRPPDGPVPASLAVPLKTR